MRTGPGSKRESSTSGVFPTRSRRLGASRLAATGHRRQGGSAGSSVHARVEPVERTHVLAADVDVDERRQVALVEELRLSAG